MRFTAGTVNTHILHVGIFGKDFEYGFKHTCLFPSGKTFVYGVPVSINRRQISPRRTRPQDPEDTIDRITYIIKRAPFTSNRQIWINLLPLFICQIASSGDWLIVSLHGISSSVTALYIDYNRFMHYSTRPKTLRPTRLLTNTIIKKYNF